MQYHFIYGPTIRWKININEPSSIKLKSIIDFSFLNPLKYYNAYKENNFISKIIFVNNFALFSTYGLVLKSNSDFTINNPEIIGNLYYRLIKYIRYESMQSEISMNHLPIIKTFKKIEKGYELPESCTRLLENEYLFKTYVNLDIIRKADKIAKINNVIPIYDEILLDAIDSWYNLEHRKAILFSAIAVESLLANLYNEIYENIILSGKTNRNLRLIVNKNNKKLIDPIFKAISEKTDFKKLLHEIPLYLFKKSVLMDNEQLYHKTIKLYLTRNKIVHFGSPNNVKNDQILSIDELGSNEALKTTIDIFNWAGITKYNNIISKTFITI